MYASLLEELQTLVYGKDLSPVEERIVTVLRDAVRAMAKGPMLPRAMSHSQVPKESSYTEPRVFHTDTGTTIIASYRHPYLPDGGAARVGEAKWEELLQEVVEWTSNMIEAGLSRYDEVIPHIAAIECTFGTNSWVDITIKLDKEEK